MQLAPSRNSRIARACVAPLAVALVASLAGCVPPSIAKGWILRPWRRSAPPEPSIAHEDVACTSDEGVELRGWRFPALGPRRGRILYLHGIGDDRRGGEDVARRLGPFGFDVLAFDARAQGRSDGDACTYGVKEARDVVRILAVHARDDETPIVLLGNSLGGSTALLAAAIDPRVARVVAIAPFSDLRTVAHERAPWFVLGASVDAALAAAGDEATFAVDEASPLAAAPSIRCPVLLVHGASDTATPPEHSKRILAALGGEKELLLVPGVDHQDPLPSEAWSAIERFVVRCQSNSLPVRESTKE